MMRLRTLAAVCGVVALSACTAAPVEEPVPMAGDTADQAAIEAVMQSVATAWNAKDAAALAAMVTDDYHAIGPDGEHVMGRAGYQADLEAEFAEERPEGFTLTLETGYIDWHSYDLAAVGGTYMVAGLPEGMPNSGSWLVNVERSDTGWLMSNGLVSQFVPEEILAAAAGGGQ